MSTIWCQSPGENPVVFNFESDEQLMRAALDVAQAFKEGRGTWIGIGATPPAGGAIVYIPSNSPIRLEFDGGLPVGLIDELRRLSRGE